MIIKTYKTCYVHLSYHYWCILKFKIINETYSISIISWYTLKIILYYVLCKQGFDGGYPWLIHNIIKLLFEIKYKLTLLNYNISCELSIPINYPNKK